MCENKKKVELQGSGLLTNIRSSAAIFLVDWTTIEKNQIKTDGLEKANLSQSFVARFVNELLASIQMTSTQSLKKERLNQRQGHAIIGRGEKENECQRKENGEQEVFQRRLELKHSACFVVSSRGSVLWCGKSLGSGYCHKYCTVLSSRL